jgi:hypothetical protein
VIRRWANLRTVPPLAIVDPVGARVAVRESHRRLAEEKVRSGHTLEVTNRLRELQERNHFAELLAQAMSPKDPVRGR